MPRYIGADPKSYELGGAINRQRGLMPAPSTHIEDKYGIGPTHSRLHRGLKALYEFLRMHPRPIRVLAAPWLVESDPGFDLGGARHRNTYIFVFIRIMCKYLC